MKKKALEVSILSVENKSGAPDEVRAVAEYSDAAENIRILAIVAIYRFAGGRGGQLGSYQVCRARGVY